MGALPNLLNASERQAPQHARHTLPVQPSKDSRYGEKLDVTMEHVVHRPRAEERIKPGSCMKGCGRNVTGRQVRP